MHSPVMSFLEAGRSGLIHPLHGHPSAWRIQTEVTPIYTAMLSEGWANPFLADHEAESPGAVLVGELAE